MKGIASNGKTVTSIHRAEKPPSSAVTSATPSKKWSTFSDALASQESNDKLIILSLVDSGFLDIAANYYITSIHRYDLHKYFLFVALDNSVCLRLQECLQELGTVPCFVYGNDPDAGIASTYGSRDFHRKTNSRNSLILEALKLGYTVLNADTDLYFFSNPLPEVISTCDKSGSGCDVAPLLDKGAWNSGFIYVRPTNRSVALYEETIKRFQKEDRDDQLILNDVIKDMMEEGNTGLNLAGLDTEKFTNGDSFSDAVFPPRAANWTSRVVVHNNRIIGKEAKIWRFKRTGMWRFDESQCMHITRPSIGRKSI